MARAPEVKPLQRHQRRAVDAYAAVSEVPATEFDDYKIAVMALGSNILRSGLAGAMAVLERATAGTVDLSGQVAQPGRSGVAAPAEAEQSTRAQAIWKLRRHLARAGIPGIPSGVTPTTFLAEIRGLGVNEYILATRESLQVVLWLRRAVQARKE